MSDRRLRILYLSNAFPPGVTGRFPAVNPAGHATETRMTQALARLTDLTSITFLGNEAYGALEPRDESFGLEHELILWDRTPELWHRWHSWRELREYYRKEIAVTGLPDLVLVRNLNPVFNRFVRWLRTQSSRPRIVLVFADSSSLGKTISWSKRLRYSLKPMYVSDQEAIGWYDGCISFGIGTEPFFQPLGIPWMWMPSAFNFAYDPPPEPPVSGPITFGYFGALASHASVVPMVELFVKSGVPGTLHACGFGKQSAELEQLAARHPPFRFDGLLPQQSDCLAWAQKVDVLINPRLNIWGLENSFPSKIFEYAMAGKAILTTRTGGVDRVLGERAFYFETEGFEQSYPAQLRAVAALDREELRRRGRSIRQHILEEYTWDRQAQRMTEFMTGLVRPG